MTVISWPFQQKNHRVQVEMQKFVSLNCHSKRCLTGYKSQKEKARFLGSVEMRLSDFEC